MAGKQTRPPSGGHHTKTANPSHANHSGLQQTGGGGNRPVEFGGRIILVTQNWKEITSDTRILNMIEGVKLEFHKCPQQKFTLKSYKFEKEDKQLINEELSTFFNRSIIERATSDPDQIVSNIFSRKKKSGKVRIILNLSEYIL